MTGAEIVRRLSAAGPTIGPDLGIPAMGWRRTKGYAVLKAGEWPTPVVKRGNSYRIITRPFLDFLGLTPDMDGAEPASPATVTDTTASGGPRRDDTPSSLRAV